MKTIRYSISAAVAALGLLPVSVAPLVLAGPAAGTPEAQTAEAEAQATPTIVETGRYERAGLRPVEAGLGFWCQGDSFLVGFRAWRPDENADRVISTQCATFEVEGTGEPVLRSLAPGERQALTSTRNEARCSLSDVALTQYLKEGSSHQARCERLEVPRAEGTALPVTVSGAPTSTTENFMFYPVEDDTWLNTAACPEGSVVASIFTGRNDNDLIAMRCHSLGVAS